MKQGRGLEKENANKIKSIFFLFLIDLKENSLKQ